MDYLLSRVFVQLDQKGHGALEPHQIEQVERWLLTREFTLCSPGVQCCRLPYQLSCLRARIYAQESAHRPMGAASE